MKDIRIINGEFERATPESQGLSSKTIEKCLEKIKSTGIFMHSMHIFKNGYLVAGGCADPISLDGKRRVYSIMKSVTALAIDFHFEEGTFGPQDSIIKYFPELKTDKHNEFLNKLTIEDALTMRIGHGMDAQLLYDRARYGLGGIPKTQREAFAEIPEDVKGKTLKQLFFDMSFEHEPGTRFMYDNTVPDIVGMLAENVSGQNYFDYLKPRLFEPLGIDCCHCSRIDDYDGSDRNFSATTVMTLRDVLKIGLLYLQHGSWEGKQIIDRGIIDAGIKKHCDTSGFHKEDLRYGYGYFLWMNRYGGFNLIGGNSQICCCVPAKNLMIAFTCFDKEEGSSPDKNILSIIWDTVIEGSSDSPIAENPADFKAVNEAFDNWSTAPQTAAKSSVLALENERKYRVLDNELGITKLSVNEDEKTIGFSFANGKNRTLYYGTDGKFVYNSKGLGHSTDNYSSIFGVDPEEVYANGGWQDNEFVLTLHYSAHMNSYQCRFMFENDIFRLMKEV